MNTESILILALALASVGFLLLILGQAKQIRVLKEENQRLRPVESQDELIADAQEKLKTLGVVKTVKYLREYKGMSMVDAKRLVDTIKE
ncbi:hypothetical protein CSV78_07015 [Sporosarcina sp. P16a]|uniref:hypothetical protein n=1 Tax=unclassified Sporosarcina TaxID=2647733 RepID=UPI000C16F204|nr:MULTISPECIES: hypothetical protein [unclassified Sporosarcina]PIC67647.1 hypothetical protein CSV78_07015 [Sporosarcina sp. P16a]PIC93098.1 hypothetical protein CSV70_07765 [Sporosarcina sp. P25]